MEHGAKLPQDLTAEELERLAHAPRPERVYGVMEFVEYAKEGGEMQTAANGYGPEERTGLSARKDTFTMKKFYPELYAAFVKCAKEWDVYFFDENNILYGVNDGTDVLAGYCMADVYANATEFDTSSAKGTMTITFSHSNAKDSAERFDYVQLPFNPRKLILGLVGVCLEKTDGAGNEYKLFERIGGNDITAEYGPVIASAGQEIIEGASSAVSYNAATKTLTIASSSEVSLKAPDVLFAKDIKGIEQV